MDALDIVFWHWWVLTILLLGIEILAPGFFFLWLSIAAFVVGTVLLLIPSIPLDLQIVIFSALSIISVLAWRRFGLSNNDIETDQPLLNKRGAQYIGRTFSLLEPIKNGRGKIKADDTLWTVTGEDCPVGSQVEVVEANGTMFAVKCIANTETPPTA